MYMLRKGLVALALTFGSVGVQAADFPEKNIDLIVPFASGGAVDFTARLIAEAVPEYFDGKDIIVKNMPGGGAVIGQTFVSRAPNDGYTLLAMTSSVVNNPLTKPVSYAVDSFTPLALYNLDPEVIVAPVDGKYKTLDDFLTAARKGSVSIATPGHSTSHHMAALSLAQEEDLEFRYIHNTSAAMQLQQIMGGHVQAGFMSLGEAVGPAQDGSIRILALMGEQRSKLASDVPTYEELTGEDMQWGTFRGIGAPANLPDEVRVELEKRLGKLLADPEFVSRMNDAGYQVVYRDGAGFSEYLQSTSSKMEKVVSALEASS